MYSTHDGLLDTPSLPLSARKAHIVPDLTSHSLLSIGQLCDSGCDVIFTAGSVEVYFDDALILQGYRSTATNLWHVNLPAAPHSSLSAVGAATPADLVAFGHAALFSPVLGTLATALGKGYLENFPGISSRSLRKYPPLSAATIKGHLDQARKNQRSTQPGNIIERDDPILVTDLDSFPEAPTDGAATHYCYACLFEPTGQIYTDQTEKFVAPSSNGNNYFLVLYDWDSNAILAEALKNRLATSILAGYKKLHAVLCAAGRRPKLQKLDNECSTVLKAFMHQEDIDFQLVPPGLHRQNAAERAIRTFKNHFIAGPVSHTPLTLQTKRQ